MPQPKPETPGQRPPKSQKHFSTVLAPMAILGALSCHLPTAADRYWWA
jgi:hypothetical protein